MEINYRNYWSQENIPNDLFILLQKLSNSNKLNIKELYDKYKVIPVNIKKKTKKQLLIDKNISRVNDKILQKDREIISNYKENDEIDFINWIYNCKSIKGKEELKIEALKKFIKNKKDINKIELLIQIDKKLLEPKQIKFFEKQYSKISNLNLKRIQLKCLGNRLPPLDFYNNNEFSLESWQVEVIDSIKAKKSLLVCAPTSSGKTILSTYFSSINYKILYIVPSKPLAFQVLAIFHKIVKDKIGIFVDDFSYSHEEPLFIVGTPACIENKLPFLTFKPDLVVYDEIHNLNYTEGDNYERLIKLLDYNFLALSATIPNSTDIINWWKKIHPKINIKYVLYKKRFINIQRYKWNNNQIEKIHPLSCLNTHIINNNLEDISLPLTPWDSFSIWSSLKKYDNKLYNELDPEYIFKDKLRLSLNDSKKYEDKIKESLNKLSNNDLVDILDKYKVDKQELSDEFDIFKLSEQLKYNLMIPVIIFNINSSICLDMFNILMESLEKKERFRYPFHYENLEFKHKLYLNHIKNKQKFEENNSIEEREKKIDNFLENELTIYKTSISDLYKKQLYKIDKTQIDNASIVKNFLKNTYTNDMLSKQIEEPDIFEKHPDFCFSKVPMKADKIRGLRKEMISKLGINITYTNNLIQGLKRGIGIYIKNLPDIYLRIVQELAQNKELGIVFSDDSLALGINMPFKTAILAGWKKSKQFDSILYHQMIGRAGRRGLDTEGNLLFVNIDWQHLLTTSMNPIIGVNNIIPEYYNVINKINPNYNFLNLYKTNINSKLNNKLNNYNYSKYEYNSYNFLLIWKLVKYNNLGIKVIDYINIMEMEYKDIYINANIENTVLYNMINMVYNIQLKNDIYYKNIYDLLSTNNYKKHYDLYEKYKIINTVREIGDIFKIIHNIIINNIVHNNIKIIYKKLFNKCKIIILNYLELN